MRDLLKMCKTLPKKKKFIGRNSGAYTDRELVIVQKWVNGEIERSEVVERLANRSKSSLDNMAQKLKNQ